MNVDKHIDYWRNGAMEDMDVARALLEKNKNRHCLFFCHLAIEKILKAHVVKMTGKVAPKMHNLMKLAKRAAINLEGPELEYISEINEFNIEGRYPDEEDIKQPSNEYTRIWQNNSEEILTWLTRKL